MATFAERLAIIITADGKGAVREMNKVGRAAERDLGRANAATRNWEATLTKLGVTLTAAAAAGAIGLHKLANATSDVVEAQNQVAVTFGDSAGVVEKFSEQAAKSAGIAQAAALHAAGGFGAMFHALGLAEDSAASMSVTLGQLAGDLASFYDVDPTEILVKLQSALSGQVRPLRTFGVNLLDTRVKAKALELGLADVGGQISETAKVQARYALILQDTAIQQGDFARTSDSLANQQRTLSAEFKNLEAAIGKGVYPGFQALNKVLGATLDGLTALPDGAKATIGSVAGIATAAAGTVGVLSLLSVAALKAKRSLANLAVESPRVAAGLSRISKAAAVAVAGLIAFETTKHVLDSVFGPDNRDVDRTVTALEGLASGVDLTGSALEDAFGIDLSGFAADVERASNSAIFQPGGVLRGFSGEFKQAQTDVDNLDKALALLVSTGKEDVADEALKQLDANLAAAGVPLDLLLQKLPLYQQALTDAGIAAAAEGDATKRAAGGHLDLAAAARKAGVDLGKLKDAAFDALTPLQQLSVIRIEGFQVKLDTQASWLSLVDAVNGVTDAYQNAAGAANGAAGANDTAAHSAQAAAEQAISLRDAHLGVERAAEGVHDAQRGLASAQRNQADAAKDVATEQENLDHVLHGYARSTDEARDAVEALRNAQSAASHAQLNYRESLQALAIAQAQGSGTDVEAAQLRVSDALDQVNGSQRDLTDQQRKTRGVLHGYARGSDEARKAQDDLREAQRHLQDATEATRDAQLQLRDAHLTVHDAAVAVGRAELDARDATRQSGDTASDASGTWLDFAQALNSAEQSADDYARKVAGAQGATEGTTEWTRRYRTALEKVQELVKPGTPLYKWLDLVINHSDVLAQIAAGGIRIENGRGVGSIDTLARNNGGKVPTAAVGRYVPATPGGQIIRAGEAGAPEVVISAANTPEQAAGYLDRIGQLDKLASGSSGVLRVSSVPPLAGRSDDVVAAIRALSRRLDSVQLVQNNYWPNQELSGELARANYRLTRKLERL